MTDSLDQTNATPGARLQIASSEAAGSYGNGSTELGKGEVHLLDYVKVLYKRRWTALTAFLVVLTAVCLYTFTATPVYEAKVRILIDKESQNVVSFKEAVEQNQISEDYYQTQYKILQSRALARRTLDALHLWNNPQLNSPPGRASVRSMLFSPVALVGRLVQPAPSAELPALGETKTQSRVIDAFLGRLTIAPVRTSRLVDVEFDSTDPALATNVANELSRQYIQQSLDYKLMSSKEASDWLGQQLEQQRKKVEASEQALQRYREQSDAVSLEDRQNIVVQKLSDLNAALTRAKTDRIQKEAAYNQIKAVQNDPTALDSIPSILSNSFIQQQKLQLADLQQQKAQLSEKLGPNHPDMVKLTVAIRTAQAKIQGEIEKVVQATRNDYQSALAQEQSLTGALDQQKQDALALNRKGIDYGVLQRDATTNKEIFDTLLQRTKETGIAGELRTSNIRIIDPAELPRTPASPNVRNNLLVAFCGGLTLAIGLAFFFEYLDNRIKTPDEIKQHLGLPFLGMVPALFDVKENPLLNNGVPANFAESFRAVRTNVLFSSAEEGGRSLVVTSAGPGEGKTMVSANLAIALAQSGEPVLLIDGDMRKPRVHEVMSVPQVPGLSNVLVGTAKASEAVHQTSVPGLWVLAAGVTPPNPAELLGSKRFKDFIQSLRQHFEWIVLDTPPVMAVTDSAVAAHLVSGVVFVVGAEMTSRYTAQRALEQLDHAKAKFVGAVLNRVDLKHNAYYYSQYYRREYADYYHKDPQA